MTSIRRRLTVWYSLALLISLGAFGTALYVQRGRSALREIDERLVLEGNLAAQYFVSFQSRLGRTLGQGETPTLVNAVGGYLDGIRDYVVVLDPDGAPIFRNAAARGVSIDSLTAAVGIATASQGTLVRTGEAGGQGVRYARVPLSGVWDRPAVLLVAAPRGAVPFGPQALLRTMLLISPLVILLGVAVGYILADASIRPLHTMVDEIEAITDGKNLHRRLAVPFSADELARLANTTNRMLARLEESFNALRRFTADASHELKTPLQVLRAGVERAMSTPGTPTDVLQSLEEVQQEIHRMSELVENLLTLARADEGRANLALAPCDLRELISEASETASILGEQAQLTVRTEVPESSVVVSVDRSRIRQLLLNLITNATKFTPPGGKVSLGLVDKGDHATIIVGDSGVGIPSKDLPHIFDRFYQVDTVRSRTGEHPGAGLGLAITKWIAEAHGGSIAVQSRQGRGTAFTVTLPRSGTTAETQSPASNTVT
jgi:signal transduction histidine kinase